MTQRAILHVTVGNEYWTPTTSELNLIKRKFRDALQGETPDNMPVVVTRDGVKAEVKLLEYKADSLYTSGYAVPQMMTNSPATPINPSYVISTTVPSEV